MTSHGSSVLNVLQDCALLRVMEGIGLRPPTNAPQWFKRTHPFIALNDRILREMRRLGRLAQGGAADLQGTAYWALLEHRRSYVEEYERGRRFVLEELTRKAIYDGISRRNTLIWQDWTVTVGAVREVSDPHGRMAFESRIWVCGKDTPLTMFSGISKQTAGEIYTHIAGHRFTGRAASPQPGWSTF